MTRLRQTIARRLKDAQNTAAMLTTFNEVDMSAVMKLRSEYKDLFEDLLKQGFVERSNVQIVNELVNLIVAQRAYEVNSRAIQASDQMLSTATNLSR